jgi:hypothetical protein
VKHIGIYFRARAVTNLGMGPSCCAGLAFRLRKKGNARDLARSNDLRRPGTCRCPLFHAGVARACARRHAARSGLQEFTDARRAVSARRARFGTAKSIARRSGSERGRKTHLAQAFGGQALERDGPRLNRFACLPPPRPACGERSKFSPAREFRVRGNHHMFSGL